MFHPRVVLTWCLCESCSGRHTMDRTPGTLGELTAELDAKWLQSPEYVARTPKKPYN